MRRRLESFAQQADCLKMRLPCLSLSLPFFPRVVSAATECFVLLARLEGVASYATVVAVDGAFALARIHACANYEVTL